MKSISVFIWIPLPLTFNYNILIMDLFISTSPFGVSDPSILEPINQYDFSWSSNKSGRKLKPEELLEIAKDCKALVAGTENLLPLININPNLKMIARVGIGLDGVPLHECRKRGIKVSWTPDAVTRAVAELTLGQMVCISRFVHELDAGIRHKEWNRPAGRGIGESTIGLIGFGRIGTTVARLLSSFTPRDILVRDIKDKTPEIQALQKEGIQIRSVGLEELLQNSHILSLHVPLWKETRHMISTLELEKMRSDSIIINTARGGIIDEVALEKALEKKMISGAGIDVFEKEPYTGPLREKRNCLLTPHLGSCKLEYRSRMNLKPSTKY